MSAKTKTELLQALSHYVTTLDNKITVLQYLIK